MATAIGAGAAWGGAIGLVAWGVAAWMPWWFITDHLAGLVAQGLMGGALVVGLCLACRRWAATGMALVGLGLMGGVLAWSHRPAGGAPGAGGAADPSIEIRALVVNFLAQNPSPQAAFAQVSEADADLMAWVETPQELIDRLRWDTAFRERYPHRWLPERAGTGFPILLSRWPLLTRRSGWRDRLEVIAEPGGFLLAVVDHPDGQFVAVWASPLSPRHTQRWREGNATVRALAEGLGAWFGPAEARALPVVVLGDQNATPTNWRSRFLRSACGLRRAKPLLMAAGTFPSALAWPLRVAIDDALVSDGVRVRGWRTLEPRGSDHLPVVMELSVPGGRSLPSGADGAEDQRRSDSDE